MSGFDRYDSDPDPSFRKHDGVAMEERRSGVVSSYSSTTGNATITGALRHTGTTAGFFNATAVTRPAALTAANGATVGVVFTSTEQGVINNMRTRIGELEAKLQSLGLLS